MAKIGIVTIIDYTNYGNRLQNYATQEILNNLGFEVETIVNYTNVPINDRKSNSIINRIRRISGLKLKEFVDRYKYKSLIKMKSERFKSFTHTYIKETDFVLAENNVPININEKFDFFITGSDQVWNPYCRFGSSLDFLTFAKQQKRIAFSPSFGISDLPIEYKENYKKWLNEMKHLSVREEAGAKIIKNLTGRDAVILVDPTLMLTKQQWLSISQPASNKPQGKYLLTYFVGELSEEYKLEIKNIAQDNNLKIINLANIEDRDMYTTSPSEFIDYINSASVFCTDSFHGVVFSILLEKPFIVFDRISDTPSMNSRIWTILSTFELESRHERNVKKESIFDIDYSHVDPILERERNKALNFLKEALKC